MCRSLAEGGQRCASHTRAKLRQMSKKMDKAVQSGEPEAIAAAQHNWEQAAVQYASTEAGAADFKRTVELADMTDDPEEAAMFRSILARGEQQRQANAETGKMIRLAEGATHSRFAADRAINRDPNRETITSVQFGCEVHDTPGGCDIECAALLTRMDPPQTVDFDPTGCSYPAPATRHSYFFDDRTKGTYRVGFTPNELLP